MGRFAAGGTAFSGTIRKMAQDRREPSAVHVVGNTDWDGLHRPRIHYAMVAVFSGLFLSVIDDTICAAAFPTIARRSRISSSVSVWIVNAFRSAVVMTLSPCSASGESSGFKCACPLGMAFSCRRFAVSCLVRLVCTAGPFTHVARRGGSQGDGRERLFGASGLSDTPSGRRVRLECHGRGSVLRVRAHDIWCDFIRSLLAMAVCFEAIISP